MASFLLSLFLYFSAFTWAAQLCHGRSTTFRFDMHHRFSDPVKRWAADKSGVGFRPDEWPEKGTVDYYAALADHDRILRRRGLSSSVDNQSLTFYEGNETFRINSLGFLHYAAVSLGTPNETFLVALDTGSDLFWVPCDCIQCAPTSASSYGFDINFNIYSPNRSSTSKMVPCSNSLCDAPHKCQEAGSNCPYKVAYVSTDTSSSGILIEDVMYLRTEDGSEVVDARIVFGCGQIQSGSFLDVAAPNGLFGLGMEKISVPSILSTAGLTADSFSMCFGRDGIGRIIFGDRGSPDQEETPFNLKHLNPTYNVSVTGLRVGTSLIDTNFSALMDSGTSFTYLADPIYRDLSGSVRTDHEIERDGPISPPDAIKPHSSLDNFNSQVQDKRHSPDARIPFEYCYNMSANDSSSPIPSISLTMKGGGQFSVFDPIIVVSAELVYCLAVVKSRNLNIVGQNFMTGQRVVFDREKSILGWKKFDCYDIEDSTITVHQNGTTTAVPPAVAVGPNSYTPEATKENGNNGSVLPVPPLISQSPHSSIYLESTPLMLFLLILFVIL